MNTQSNKMPEPRSESQAVRPEISEAQRMYWSVRRELWESRSIYIAPLSVAIVTLFGFLIASMGRALSPSNLAQRQAVLEEPYTFATGLIMATAFIVGIFYCLDALHGERRDRSILFWKSLPVSDLSTVLSKASIPLVILPLITFAIVVVTQWMMVLMSTLVLLGSGLDAATLWRQVSLSQMMLLYHLLTVHVLWHAPLYAWLLLVSAWARRMTFLWAVLPVLGIGALEKIAFNTTHFLAFLGYRLSGPENFNFPSPRHLMPHLDPAKFLRAPGLWLGLAVAAALLAASVRLRRYQGPI